MKQSDVRTFADQSSIPHISSPTGSLNDAELQNYLLQGVSRTFALTIPQLPSPLDEIISNAYLLCRTIDTIEDEVKLTKEQKTYFSEKFVEVVSGKSDIEAFASQLYPQLSTNTSQEEKELVQLLPRVVSITHSFDKIQQNALEKCVSIMSKGMIYYQLNVSPLGLPTLEAHNAYCYHVAGVVGEMLTELFSHYSKDIAEKREELLDLAVSFGQGLQMTNILKDVWDDYERGVCWLPRDIFEEFGFNLEDLPPESSSISFRQGLVKMIGIAHGHLKNALEYTLLIPPKEKGIRRFCLWALGMAILTLRKIYFNQDYRDGSQVKISRKSVKTTIVLSNLWVKHNSILRALFYFASSGVPYYRVSQ